MINVLIAADHAVVRRGLKEILAATRGIVVAGEATNLDEMIEQLRAQDWDLVILDVAMPGGSDLGIFEVIRQFRSRLPVLMLSVHSEEHARRMLKAGASGCLNKESTPKELVAAVRKLHAGGKYFSPRQGERRAAGPGREATALPHELLSDREREVLCLIATGNSVTQIARYLSLSAKTVSTYRTRSLTKMQMSTNAQLTHYATKHRLLG